MNNKIKSIMLFISKCTNVMVGMLAMIIIARKLTTIEYSDFKQISTQVSMICSICSIGVPYSVLYFFTSTKKRKEYFINVLIAIIIICIVILIIGLPILNIFDEIFKTSIFIENYKLILVFTIFSFISFNVENIFIGFDDFVFIILNSIIPNSIFFIAIIILGNKLKFIEVIYIFTLREFIRIILFSIFCFNKKLNFKLINIARVKEILWFGIPIGLSSIIGTLNINIDKIIAGSFVSKEAFALLAVASYEIPVMGLIGVSLFNIMIKPLKNLIIEKKYNESIELWIRCGEIMITLIVPIVITIVVFANEVVLILFSSKYSEATSTFRIYQVNALTRIYIFGTFFLAANKSKLYSLNAVITLVINILLSLLLVKPLGINGVAISTVLSNIICIIIQNIQISKITSKKIIEVYPYRNFLKSISISIIVSLIIYRIYDIFLLKNLLVAVIFMIISILSSFIILSKIVNKEVLNQCYFIVNKITKLINI